MLNRAKTVLLVVDFQEKLLPKIAHADDIVPQAIRLIRFAHELELAVLVTEQYPKGLGRTVQPVEDELRGAVPIEKTSFGCFGDKGFCEAISATGCQQLLVTGIETHVCVMQTVLAGLESGYEAFVVRDAIGSRHTPDYEAGLVRMQTAGAYLVTTEMALFELLGEAGTPEFKRVLPLLK
jgi:nicotinamidase-related amidase